MYLRTSVRWRSFKVAFIHLGKITRCNNKYYLTLGKINVFEINSAGLDDDTCISIFCILWAWILFGLFWLGSVNVNNVLVYLIECVSLWRVHSVLLCTRRIPVYIDFYRVLQRSYTSNHVVMTAHSDTRNFKIISKWIIYVRKNNCIIPLYNLIFSIYFFVGKGSVTLILNDISH